MALILPRRSLLAIPSGGVPGFDPAHPAAKGTVRFSGVSQNGGFINLLSGVVGTNANGPTCSIDGRLGESTGYAVAVSAAVATSWTGQAAVNDNNATIAAIVRFNTLNSFNAIFANNSGSGNAFALFQQGGFLMMRHGITNSVSTLAVTTGVPYFVAGSANGGASGSISYVVKRLDTGAVTSVNQTGTITAVTSAGTYYVGNWGGLSLPTDGIVAAAAYTNAYMTPSELVAWSNDPWSFWYPPAPPAQRKVSYSYSYAPAGTTTTNGARVLQRFNQSKLAYPAGAVPGFDRANPAAQGMSPQRGWSGVAGPGGTFIDLLGGTPFTPQNSPTMTITSLGRTLNATVGPYVQVANSTASFAGQTTMAWIFSIKAVTLEYTLYAENAASPSAFISTTGFLGVFSSGGGIVTSGLSLTAGTNYFVVLVQNSPSITWYVTNLTTGQVRTQTQSSWTSNGGASPFHMCGQNAHSWNGNMAAAMMAPTAISPQQAFQWTKDPWSFWYPNKMLNLTDTASVTPTAIQYAAFSIPQHDGQSITQMMGY